MHISSPLKSGQQGAVLLEAMIAILIFSMGVLAIVGLQAAMIKNTADSKYRADAGFIAQERIGQIWADPDPTRPGYTSYVEANTDISSRLPGGTRTVTQTVAGQFKVGADVSSRARQRKGDADVGKISDPYLRHGDRRALGHDTVGGVRREADSAPHHHAVHDYNHRLGVARDQYVEMIFG